MDNKSKIIEVIKSYYGDNEISDDELKRIEKIAQDDKNTQDLIDILTKSKSIKASDSRNIKESLLLNTIKMLELRSNSNTNQNTKENIDKIMEATNEYFGDNKVDFTEKQKDLINSVAKFDDATNNLVKWLDDAVQNDEERNIKNYFIEVMDAYEDHLSINESKEFVKQLKELNPDVDIELSNDYNSIDISKPINELNMPETFCVDENNFITNKENTALSVFVSLKVNEKNNNMTKGENNMKSEERKEEIIIDNDFLEESITNDKDKKNQKSKKTKKEKNKKIKSFFGFFKKIYNFFKNKFIMPDDLADEEINLDNDSDVEKIEIDVTNKDSKEENITKNIEKEKIDNNKNTEKFQNKESAKKIVESGNKNEDNDKKIEELESESDTKKEEESKSATDNGSSTLTFGEDLNNLDNDSDVEKIEIDVTNKDSKEENITKNIEKEKIDNNKNTEKFQNKESAKKIVESGNKNEDNDKKIEELESESDTKKEEESKSATDNGSSTLTFEEDLNRIDEIRSEIERLQRNMIIIKKNKLRLENAMGNIAEKGKNKLNEKDEIKENEKKEQSKNEVTNEIELRKEEEEKSRIEELGVRIRVNNASKFATEGTIKHYEDEFKHYIEKIEMQEIQIQKIIDKYNSEFNEAWYGHMGEKVTEDLLKRRSTLKNELDAINIKLNLLKQKREEIVAENPMIHARTM